MPQDLFLFLLYWIQKVMLKSVEDYCGAEVLSDCRFGEIDRRKKKNER